MDNKKMKFRIEINKLNKGQLQLGCFLNRNGIMKDGVERYLYICLFKITISIGWFC